MKFFTSEWWASESDDNSVFERYSAYFESVRDRLPPDVVKLRSHHTLHDSRLQSVHCDFGQGLVEMVLNGWDAKLENPVRYVLDFSGVTSFEERLAGTRGSDPELGDLGYWEVEALESTTELRMLFVSGAQFTVVFHGLQLTHEPRGRT